MKVKDLRKALKGVNGNMDVYTKDHDHSEYETNGLAGYAEVVNQKNMDEYEKERLDPCFKIKGNYFVVSV
jgi:hypothetical protein